ncbi:MAG: redox-regulated ATPase YchF [Sulfobacillus sp.]
MDVGLIGLPRCGKTTVFNLLTHSQAEVNQFGGGRAESRQALAPIPDHRLTWLSNFYHPKKVTPAQLSVVDVPGLSRSESGGPNRFLNDVRLVDALILVVRGYPSELGEPAAPLADIEEMELELMLSDLDLLEKRKERIRTGKKITREYQEELDLVDRLIDALENNQRLNQMTLNEDELRLIRGYQFLTLKPLVWVINLDEEQFKTRTYRDDDQIVALAATKDVPVVTMAAALEQEIEQLSDEDQKVFMSDLGIDHSGLSRVAGAMYQKLGLISFLTAGEDEVRAWTIKTGTLAKQAAGKIHSDIERGFIRAEVVAYEDLVRAASMVKAREMGLVRLEGKDYVMKDGDVVNFRFNV